MYTRRAMVVITSLSTTLGTTSILTFKFNLWNFGIECLLMLQLVREAINCHMLYSYLNHFWNFGIECLLMLQLVREAINCHMLYSYLNHFWCSLFHTLSQWRHVKEWANNKQRLWLSEQTQDNFCLFVLAHSLGFFFHRQLVLKLPIFNVTKLCCI